MKTLHLTVPRTARYCLLGEPGLDTHNFWLACHGYGQLAPYFSRHFEDLLNPQTVVAAPEALSRFYLNGFSGRVGASWMTKEERLSEIQDYVHYLDLLVAELQQQAPHAGVNVLGFSQGAATVCRWLAATHVTCRKLVLWAGVFPEDIEYNGLQKKLSHTKVYLVYGTEDEFLNEEKLAQQLHFLRHHNIEPELVRFEGKHELNKAGLHKLLNE